MPRKHTFVLFFILGISFLLSCCFSPPFDLMFDDREVFSYAGMAILKGLVPYRDFFDHKPPGIFFINAAGSLLGGLWGLWAINTVLVLSATWLLYRTCVQYRMAFPWLLPLLFNLMIRDNLITMGAGMTREYTTIFFVFFFCIYMGKSRFREMLLGLFTGLIFFTQQVLEEVGIPLFRDTLPGVMEIVIVIIGAKGDTVEDGGGQASRVRLPLLNGIVLEKGLIEVAAQDGHRLFFKIFRFPDVFADGGHEVFDLKGPHRAAVELVEGRKIDGEGVYQPFMGAEHFMAISIERRESFDIIPNLFIGRVEDMGTVAVVFNTGGRVGRRIAIAADVGAFFDDQDGLVQLAGDTFRNDCAEESAADDYVGIVS